MKSFCFQLQVLLCVALLLAATSGASCVSAQKTADDKALNQSASALQNTLTSSVAEPKLLAVTQVDLDGLKALLKKNADVKRPLLINFWATWCAPCREEFPELVKIDREFRPQGLEFVTVSLDDLADKDTEVTKFLSEMKAEMPAYLLKTVDEEVAIATIAPEWRGGLPFTILRDADGKTFYTKMGAIKPEQLRKEIEKILLKK